SSYRLDKLVDQLLDVSRITTGELRLEPELVDLEALVREVVVRLVDAGGPDQAEISIDGTGAIEGYWDRLRIDHVVTNLLSNAIKYGQSKPVNVSIAAEGGQAVLRVTDHGIGIDPDHQRKIFQRFERAVATREYGGFGLGLWITRQIV